MCLACIYSAYGKMEQCTDCFAQAEVTQLRTDLKKRDEEVGSLAAAKSHLQQKADAADANAGALQVRTCPLITISSNIPIVFC